MAFALAGITQAFSVIGQIGAKQSKSFGAAMEKTSEAVGQVSEKATSFISVLRIDKILEPVLELFKPLGNLFDIFAGVLKSALLPAIQEVYKAFFNPAVIDIISYLAEALASILAPAIRLFGRIIQAVIDSGVLDAIIGILQLVVDAFSNLWISLSPIIEILINLFMIVMDIFKDLIDAVGPIVEVLIQIFVKLVEMGLKMLMQILEPIMPVIIALLEKFAEGLEALFVFLEPFLDAILSGISTFIDGMGNVWNIFIDIINTIIDGLNALDFANLLPDIPSLPRLQGGGMVAKTGMAIVDKGEGVLNREVMQGITQVIQNQQTTSINPSTTQDTYNINAVVLNNENARQIAKHIDRRKRLVR